MEARLGLPAACVSVGNEANLAALAELWDGVARDLDSFIHVTGQVGVGAGIVIDGALYRGSRGFAGELGHMTVRPGGDRCACGARGCLETVAGIEVIRERAGVEPPGGGRRLRDGRAARPARRAQATRRRSTPSTRPPQALGIALARPSTCSTSRRWSSAAPYTPARPWLVPRVRAMRCRRACWQRRWSEFDVRGSRSACRRRCAARRPSTCAPCSTARGS